MAIGNCFAPAAVAGISKGKGPKTDNGFHPGCQPADEQHLQTTAEPTAFGDKDLGRARGKQCHCRENHRDGKGNGGVNGCEQTEQINKERHRPGYDEGNSRCRRTVDQRAIVGKQA